jgi:hypothetical protein
MKRLGSDNNSNNKSIIKNWVLLFSFFYYYIGPISVIAYLLSLLKTRWILPIKDWSILLFLFSMFLYSCLSSGFLDSIALYRFHWGFLIFYLYFRNKFHLFSFNKLLWLMLLMTLIEAALVNTIVDASSLPNYPDVGSSSPHFSNTWQRAYSFGGNSSVTGVLIVAVLSIVGGGLLLMTAALITVLLVGSGSGIIAYFIYLLYRVNTITKIVFFPFFGLFWLFSVNDIDALYKISPYYMDLLIDFKKSQILSTLDNMDYITMFVGSSKLSDTGGDFLWLSFFAVHGYAGIMLMLLIIFTHINRANIFGIGIIVLMSSHYFVLFSLPGQLIAGYLFALSRVQLNLKLKPINNVRRVKLKLS